MKYARLMIEFVKRVAFDADGPIPPHIKILESCMHRYRASRACLMLLLFLVMPWPVFAEDANSSASLSLGYRLDALDWNIGGGSGGPNILSELDWRDMDIVQLKGELSGTNAEGVYFRGFADYGWVLDGLSQDSDFAGDNRSLEFSRSYSNVDGSRVRDLSGGLGLTFYTGASDQYRIIPLIGFSYHGQQLRRQGGYQTLWDSANYDVINPGSTDYVPLGPFSGLDSSYDAEWYGPWLGVDVLLDLQEQGTAFVRLESHWVNYYARANWNLRDDFAHPVSFEHESNGRGWVLEMGWNSVPSRYRWTWGVTASLQSWKTGAGIDRTFVVDPTSPCYGYCEGPLNEVNWSSRSLNLSLSKAFSD